MKLSLRASALLGGGIAVALSVAAPASQPTAKARSVYEQYLAFNDLVESCHVTPHWIEGGKALWYIKGRLGDAQIERVDTTSGQETPLLDPDRLRHALRSAFNHEAPAGAIPFDDFSVDAAGHAEFSLEGQRYRLDLATYQITRIPAAEPVEEIFGTSVQSRLTPRPFQREVIFGATEALEAPSPDGRWLASLREGNIWIRSTADGRATALTRDGTVDKGWDFDSAVQDAWSPNGLFLLASKYDRTQVEKIPVVHVLGRQDNVTFQRFQKAGAPLDRAEVFLVPLLGKPPIHIDLGDTTDQYFVPLGWRPDGSEALIARFSRDFHRVDIIAASPTTGSSRTVLTENSRTFVRIQHEVIWGGQGVGFSLLPSGKGFLWLSERNGWKHLYLYDLQGKLQRQLTHGNFPVHEVVHIDERGGWVYVLASAKARPYDRHLYRVTLAGGPLQRLTEGAGDHRVQMAPSGQAFLDTWSSVDRAPRTELRSNAGKTLQQLGQADVAKLHSVGWVAPEEFQVKAADGQTDLWGVLYKPFNFDPNRKYPLVEYIYGGPQMSNLPTTFCGSGARDENFPRAFAQLGFVVAVIAGRGTPGRSKAFQDVVYGDWAQHVIADHVGAIHQLLDSRPYLDRARVGIWGRSWGGYFAFRALAEAGDLYRAAVSIVPGFDPYNGILYEPYLGLPEEHKAAYEAASPFRLAGKIKGPYLMEAGTLDTSTYHDVLRMANALIAAGVHHELVILPNQEHMFGGEPADFARDAVIDFFGRHLALAGDTP